MYERFSNRARLVVIDLAEQEARNLSHEYIGTEHILLGMLRLTLCRGTGILLTLGVDSEKVRAEVLKLLASCASCPKMKNTGELPQTPRAKKVIEYAIQESSDRCWRSVNTEHLLIGLLRELDGVAAHALINLGLTVKMVRAKVAELFPQADGEEQGASVAETKASEVIGSDLPAGEYQILAHACDGDIRWFIVKDMERRRVCLGPVSREMMDDNPSMESGILIILERFGFRVPIIRCQ